METAYLASVAVAAATYSIDKPYIYVIPAALRSQVQPGVRVKVPFGSGNRRTEGMVLSVSQGTVQPGFKPIESVFDSEPVLQERELRLALWLRERYFCTVYDAVKTILPTGLWYQKRSMVSISQKVDLQWAELAAQENKYAPVLLHAVLNSGGEAELSALQVLCGEHTQRALRFLQEKGILQREENFSRQIKDKTARRARLLISGEEAMELASQKQRRSPVQGEVLRVLAATGSAFVSELYDYTGASSATLKALERAGLISMEEEAVFRVPIEPQEMQAEEIVFNSEQETVFQDLLALMQRETPCVSLLYGVTGCGKTQIYIHLVQEALQQGKSAMVLVPEIALTPQIMLKFTSCFGSKVAMLHSARPLSERYDQWKRIRQGEVRVVLGTRSAIFAPLKDLGLIVLDEEQESSYQSENTPHYHTREVAKWLCVQEKALLLLGSATPSVESSYYAREGVYQMQRLRHRYNQKALPQVIVADMRKELRSGNSGIISTVLRKELGKNLECGEQSILFLNRRGNSRMLQCGECGAVPECPNCSVALTYHSANRRLMCHYCGYSEKAQSTCPECGGLRKTMGVGTQKVEEELHSLFPGTELLRMDMDTVSMSHGHERVLERFSKEKIPILLGTQMVAKGLDFENVTLVGVLAADQGLYVDHYRAAEKTFSLLTQVVGRAGRGDKSGRAVIQTYTPENDVILAAAQQDYDAFYQKEIRFRQLRQFPPFADLFTITISGREEQQVLHAAAQLRLALKPQAEEMDAEVLGPAPAPVLRVNQRYRYRLCWVGKNNAMTRRLLSSYLQQFSIRKENKALAIFIECNAMDG